MHPRFGTQARHPGWGEKWAKGLEERCLGSGKPVRGSGKMVRGLSIKKRGLEKKFGVQKRVALY